MNSLISLISFLHPFHMQGFSHPLNVWVRFSKVTHKRVTVSTSLDVFVTFHMLILKCWLKSLETVFPGKISFLANIMIHRINVIFNNKSIIILHRIPSCCFSPHFTVSIGDSLVWMCVLEQSGSWILHTMMQARATLNTECVIINRKKGTFLLRTPGDKRADWALALVVQINDDVTLSIVIQGHQETTATFLRGTIEEPLQKWQADILIQHDFLHEQHEWCLISQILPQILLNPMKLFISPSWTSSGNMQQFQNWAANFCL